MSFLIITTKRGSSINCSLFCPPFLAHFNQMLLNGEDLDIRRYKTFDEMFYDDAVISVEERERIDFQEKKRQNRITLMRV